MVEYPFVQIDAFADGPLHGNPCAIVHEADRIEPLVMQRHGLIDSRGFAEQGHWMNRPGRAQVEVVGDRDSIETVRVGGVAVSIIEGTLRLP